MSLTITVELAADTQRRLEADHADLNGIAKEALLVTLYRRGRLSRPEFAAALSLDAVEAEQVLHRHRVTEDFGELSEYVDDLTTLRRIRERGSR